MPLKLPEIECDIDQLAGLLLRQCKRQSGDLRKALDDDSGACRRLIQWKLDLRDWFFELDDDQLNSDDLAELAERLSEGEKLAEGAPWTSPLARIVVVREAVVALDSALGVRFIDLARGRGRVQLEEGSAFPVSVLPRPAFERARGLSQKLGPEIDELQYLDVLGAEVFNRGHEVWLDPSHEDAFASLKPESEIALLIPNQGTSHLKFKCNERGGNWFFDEVRLVDSQVQAVTILSLLGNAAEQGASIAVLPELSVDRYVLNQIEEWFENNRESSLTMIVCGSSHVKNRNGKWKNLSVTLLKGGKRLEHAKFTAFELQKCAECQQSVVHREGIVTTPSKVTVYFCGSWSFTTLICMDFIEKPLPALLGAMRVSLVLVPACSGNTGPFEGAAGALMALGSQVRVAMANSAKQEKSDHSPALTMWGLPRSGAAVPQLERHGEVTSEPFLKLHPLGQSS